MDVVMIDVVIVEDFVLDVEVDDIADLVELVELELVKLFVLEEDGDVEV